MRKCKAKRKNIKAGFSIIELLVVVAIFSTLAVLATQSVVLTLRGSKKSESLIEVRENVNYAMSIMERLIRNAKEDALSCSDLVLNYTDQYGNPADFTCEGGSNGWIASSSARLTSEDIVVDCSSGGGNVVFDCPVPLGNAPPSVEITITAEDANSFAAEGAQVTTSTKILLRSY